MYTYLKMKREIGTQDLQSISADVCKNIIRDSIYQPKSGSGTAYTMRHVQRKMMRAAANYISRKARAEEPLEQDYKYICRNGASRNCTSRV